VRFLFLFHLRLPKYNISKHDKKNVEKFLYGHKYVVIIITCRCLHKR